jgi:hypothetical protein
MSNVSVTLPSSDLLFRMFFGFWVVYRSPQTGRVQVRLNNRKVWTEHPDKGALRTFDTHEKALHFAHEVAA